MSAAVTERTALLATLRRVRDLSFHREEKHTAESREIHRLATQALAPYAVVEATTREELFHALRTAKERIAELERENEQLRSALAADIERPGEEGRPHA